MKVVLKLFESQISKFIKGILEDQVEKVRELTLKLLDKYFMLVEGLAGEQKVDYELMRAII